MIDIQSFAFLSQQCSRVAGTVQHPHDGDLAFRIAVVDRVLLMKMDPQTGGEIITARSQFRMREQRRETVLDFPNERGRRGGTALGDERPNLDQVFFRLVGEAEDAGGVNRWLPFWMIRSGSKS